MGESVIINHPDRTGNIFIISGPSGSGKSTLVQRLLTRFADIRYSISHTTRKKRRGEQDGVHYHFIDSAAFKRLLDENKWAEWAEVHGNYYGTSVEFLRRNRLQGNDVLLEIDVQGARQILERYPDSIPIFIMPPSSEELEKRLKNRATDDPEVIRRRIRDARKEMDCVDLYRHLIINDDLEAATGQLIEIVGKYRSDR